MVIGPYYGYVEVKGPGVFEKPTFANNGQRLS
jgi:hypothetical protein